MSARVPSDDPNPSASEEARKAHIDALLDEALEDTFPASDPPAITVPAPPADGETEADG